MAECSDVYAALARLEAKIDACARKQVDEENIIQKAVQRVFGHGQWIALVGAVGFATSEVSKVRARQIAQDIQLLRLEGQVAVANSTAASALGRALDTFRRVGALEIKYGDLVARIAGLVGAVAGLMSLYATLKILIPQLNALEGRVTTLEINETRTFSLAITANQTALDARALAQAAMTRAEQALTQAYQAFRRAGDAAAMAETANNKADRALAQIPPVRQLAGDAKAIAQSADGKASDALAQIPPVRQLAGDAKAIAQSADGKASDALAQIPPVRQLAGDAKVIAQSADGKASEALAQIPPVRQLAGDAKAIAQSADGKASEALAQIPPVRQLAGDAKAIAQSADGKASDALAQILGVKAIATAAEAKATDAKSSATAADTKATDAKSSATAADTKATDAKTAAKAADTKATDAQKQAADAKKLGDRNSTRIGTVESKLSELAGKQLVPSPRLVTVEKTQTEIRKEIEKIKVQNDVNIDDIEKMFKKRNDELKNVLPLVVAGGVAIATPTLVNATKTGICQSTAPGGCMNKALDGLGGSLGNNLDRALNGLNAGMNAAQLAMLAPINAGVKEINTKLGPQVSGGISGYLGRIFGKVTELGTKLSEGFDKVYKATHMDKAVQLLTLAATIHNAAMLSNNLALTLNSTIGNVLQAIGIKDPKTNNPLDIGAIIGKEVEYFLIGTLGVDNYTKLKSDWIRASRIYSAASQIVWSVQSIGHSILSAMEVVGSHVAWIGNALRKFDVVGQRAFGWMNPSPNFDNRFFTALENIETGVSAVDQVASEALSIQDTLRQLNEQKADLNKAIAEDPLAPKKPPIPEAEATKQQDEFEKAASLARDVLLGAADAPGGV